MLPYIYTEARRTYDTGVAFLHPLYYDWPDADEAYSNKNEYMFGEKMIVAPVVAPGDKTSGLAARRCGFRRGVDRVADGQASGGPATVKRSFSIDQIPVYVRAGAIVPMQPPMRYSGQKPLDPLIVNIWPMAEKATSTYSVYEDSGKWVEYQQGVFAHLPIKATQTGDTLKVEIGPARGSFPGMLHTRAYELRLPGDWPPERVTVNGVPVKRGGPTGKGGWSYEGNTLTTVIPVPASAVEGRVVIEVVRAPGLTAKRDELDGFAGTMSRLRGAYEAMHHTWPVGRVPDLLLDAMQTGDRIGYHPENIGKELAHLKEILPQVQSAVDEMAKDFSQKLDSYAQAMSKEKKPWDMDAQKQQRTDAMAKARKLVEEAVGK